MTEICFMYADEPQPTREGTPMRLSLAALAVLVLALAACGTVHGHAQPSVTVAGWEAARG